MIPAGSEAVNAAAPSRSATCRRGSQWRNRPGTEFTLEKDSMKAPNFRALPALAACAALAAGVLAQPLATHGSPSTLYVAPGGAGTSCTASAPCGSIQQAINLAPAGGTVRVAAGFYHQIIAIEKPITLLGSGTNTVVDGWGLDPGVPLLGTVYIGGPGGTTVPGNIGGNVTIQGFTFQNPNPDAQTYTGVSPLEPILIGVYDGNPNDTITITHNQLLEGTSDPNTSTDFPIGLDTLFSSAALVADHNTVQGFFQGMLLEDNGPFSVSHNDFANMIANTDGVTNYPGEGIFVLDDTPGYPTTSGEIDHNSFSGYAGDGVNLGSEYGPGTLENVEVDHNQFNLGGFAGAGAINLRARDGGTVSDITLDHNVGSVASPTVPVTQDSSPAPPDHPTGGTISNVTESDDNITVS